jgi:hypothetical protein
VNEPALVWHEPAFYCGCRYVTATGAVVEVPRVNAGWHGQRKMAAWVIATAVAEARRRRNGWLADRWESEAPKTIPGSVQNEMSMYVLQDARRLA